MIPPRPSTCLLLLVSWLLVAFIPGLLMLATFGLERLESGLDGDTVSAADVAEFLEQARADDVAYAGARTACRRRSTACIADFRNAVPVPTSPRATASTHDCVEFADDR